MQYRLLENGEQFNEGDETLDDNCETWSRLDRHFFMAHFNPYFNVPVRRAISNTDFNLTQPASKNQTRRRGGYHERS